jgi:hypothetical protein
MFLGDVLCAEAVALSAAPIAIDAQRESKSDEVLLVCARHDVYWLPLTAQQSSVSVCQILTRAPATLLLLRLLRGGAAVAAWLRTRDYHGIALVFRQRVAVLVDCPVHGWRNKNTAEGKARIC